MRKPLQSAQAWCHHKQACSLSAQTSVLTVCTERSVADPRFYTRRHVLPGRYLHVAPTLLGGATLRWAAALLGIESVEELVRLAATCEPGAGGVIFLPYLMGERAPLWNRDARGVLYGLQLGTSQAEMARAVVEGIAFALRNVLAQIESHLGGTVTPLNVTGGAAFPLVLQTLANVLQRPLTAIEGGDSAAQGAALLALVAAQEGGRNLACRVAAEFPGDLWAGRSCFRLLRAAIPRIL